MSANGISASPATARPGDAILSIAYLDYTTPPAGVTRKKRGASRQRRTRETVYDEMVRGGRHRARARASASARARKCAILGATIALLAAPGALWCPPRAQALPSYTLYYAFQIPLALPGLSVQDSGTRTTYGGTLRGTLGGLPLRSATFTYGPGASTGAGGGTFSLATGAGDVRDGQILMTSDGERTTLLFFGIYLGSRLEFMLTSDRQQIGGSGVTAAGLARTGFTAHEAYVAAVRKGVEALPSPAREDIIAQADTNLRLVGEYEQRPATP